MKLFVLGSFIYAVILGAYTLTKNFFDYASLVQSLSADQKVNSGSFIGVALYISFCNSFLEEFFFRFVAFIRLSKYTARKIAYIFSSGMFAVYHIAMIGMSFPPLMLLLALIGLAIGGLLFDYVDSKNENIYHSWVIHMFADFAIMTIWYLYKYCTYWNSPANRLSICRGCLYRHKPGTGSPFFPPEAECRFLSAENVVYNEG